MMPNATWQQWQIDAAAAFQAVAQHAVNVEQWGAIAWVAGLLGALVTVIKVAKFLPLPPLLRVGVAALDQWLPQLTGRHARKAEQQAQRNLQVAQAGVVGIDQLLAMLQAHDPEMHAAALRWLKEKQESLGVREPIRELLKALHAAQPKDPAPTTEPAPA